MKKLNGKSALVISTTALVVSASAISVAIIYQPNDVVKQQQLLNPQGGKTSQGLEVSAYFNLIQALGFDVDTNLKTYDDQVIADRLNHWGFNQDQLSLTIASADSQTKELKFAIKVNGQSLAPIEIKGLNGDASLASSRTINNFNLEKITDINIITFDQNLWGADDYPLQLQGKGNAKQIAFLTKLTSAQIKDHISDLKIRLDQPLFGKDLITKQDQWGSYLNFQFVENEQGQLDLNITLDHPDGHQSHLQGKAGKGIEQDLEVLENRLRGNQINYVWGNHWVDYFTIGEVQPNISLNSDQFLTINQQIKFDFTGQDLEKAIVNNQSAFLDQFTNQLLTIIKSEEQLKQIFGLETINSQLKILKIDDGIKFGGLINDQIVQRFDINLFNNGIEFKKFDHEQLIGLEATIGLKHLSPFAIEFVKQLKTDQQLTKLITNGITKNQDFTYGFQFNHFGQLLENIIGPNFTINNPYTLAKTNENFQIELNYGKGIDAQDVDFEKQWGTVIDQRDDKVVTLPLDLSGKVDGYPVDLMISTKDGKLTIVNGSNLGYGTGLTIFNQSTGRLKIEMTKQEGSDYENTI